MIFLYQHTRDLLFGQARKIGLTIAEGVLPLFLSYDQTLGMPLEHLWFSNNKQTVGNGEVNWWQKKKVFMFR